MTRRTHPIPGRTADLRRTARLSLEALDGRDVPALLGLSLPVSVGLNVPVVSDLLPVNLGVTVGPLELGVSTTPEAASETGGVSLDLGRLVSLDLGLPLADEIVVPPVLPPVNPPTPAPPVEPEVPPIENPLPPVTTPPTTPPVAETPSVEPTPTPPIITPPTDRTETPTTPTPTDLPTVVETPTAPTTPVPAATGGTALPSAPVGGPPVAAFAAFAPPAPEAFVPAAVVAVLQQAEAAAAGEVQFADAPAADAPLAGLAAPDASAQDVPPVLVLPEPTPEVAPAPSEPQPGTFPVAAAEVLNQFLMFDFAAARQQAQEVLDRLGSALPDADELLGERGWWYAAALASLFAARKVVLARSRHVRRAFPG